MLASSRRSSSLSFLPKKTILASYLLIITTNAVADLLASGTPTSIEVFHMFTGCEHLYRIGERSPAPIIGTKLYECPRTVTLLRFSLGPRDDLNQFLLVVGQRMDALLI